MMTKSLEDYVEMIYVLIRDRGVAHVRDVASELDVKMPSVVKAISELKKLGYVTQEPYSDIVLTPSGEKVAQEILDRHVVLQKFLEALGVEKSIADKDACRMEHILSVETMACIRKFLQNTEK
ncbi:MAG: metal-dependent transcriptional regulator [Kiritimatiellae bacterium]|nr:metal-dependent transcriptional regulator [Kiritimatiellia bacterium]